MQRLAICAAVCFFGSLTPVMPADGGFGGTGKQMGLSTAPPPPREVVRLEDIMPSAIKADTEPVQFILWQNDKLRYGPVTLKEGASIQIGTPVYTLSNVSGKAFSLTQSLDGSVSGPFDYSENAEVKLGKEVFKVRMMAGNIRGRLDKSNLALKRIPVGLISFNEKTAPHIARLYSEFQAYNMEVEAASAPIEVIAPRVRTVTGNYRDNIIDRSAADVARAEEIADMKARKAFDKFLSKAGAKTVICNNPGDFVFQNVKPGRYLVCMIAAMKDTEPGLTLRSKSVIWWADVTLDGSQAATLLFSADNAKPWQLIFPKR